MAISPHRSIETEDHQTEEQLDIDDDDGEDTVELDEGSYICISLPFVFYTGVASVQQLLQILGNSAQTSSAPFPSLLFAMLFCLIHSPHPMVCSL